jgi:hypothetical protein
MGEKDGAASKIDKTIVTRRRAECRKEWLDIVEQAKDDGRLDPAIYRHCVNAENLNQWWPIS